MDSLKVMSDLIEIANNKIDTQAEIIKALEEKIELLQKIIDKAQL